MAFLNLNGLQTLWTQIVLKIQSITAEDVGAAAQDHKHSATDITSDTISVQYGGTGASTKALARENLGIASGTSLPTSGDAGDIFFLYNE